MLLLLMPNTLYAKQKSIEEIFSSSTRPVKIVCFGDSVTGIYYHTGGRRAYTAMLKIALQRAYPQTEIQAINAGISGNTAADGLKRIQQDVLRHQPVVVTVMFSLNDMTRIKSLDAFESQILDIVSQCQEIGAAVILCTPNSVFDTPARPIAVLEKYVEKIRQLAQEHQLPLADCYAAYEAVRENDSWAWSMLMSDEIHPNMGGHKLIAETIALTITGKSISLANEQALQPAIPFTLKQLQTGKPVKILAMPPYDKIVADTIHQQYPQAQLEITPWQVVGKTIAEIDTSANSVRAGGYHLVVVAVPWESCPRKQQSQLRSFSWVLNKSLSFGLLEWDCITVTPTVARPAKNQAEQQAYEISRQFMLNQDLTVIDRQPSQANQSAGEIFTAWWQSQQ